MDTTVRAVLCVCALLFVTQVRSSHIPPKMNRTIQNLLQHYKIQGKERYNGKPVFSRESLHGKVNEVKKVFLGGILETYDKLLNKMLDQLPTPGPRVDSPPNANTDPRDGVRDDLSYILKMVGKLQNNYQEQEKIVDELKSLQNITTDNLVIQSKALGELPWLYEEASSLLNNDRRRRRRRQSPGAKNKAK